MSDEDEWQELVNQQQRQEQYQALTEQARGLFTYYVALKEAGFTEYEALYVIGQTVRPSGQ